MRLICIFVLLVCAPSVVAQIEQDTMPFLVMPDGKKVMATHVLKFPLKREASDLAYDSVTNQFITCFDKGIPQLATFKLNDSISELRQLSIAGDTTYYDLEGVAIQRSDSQGIRLKLCGERVIRDSLPILTLRCNKDSCWHDSALVLTRPFEPGVNTNWEGIAITSGGLFLAKERDPADIYCGNLGALDFQYFLSRTRMNCDAGGQPTIVGFADLNQAYAGVSSARVKGRERLAYSSLLYDDRTNLLLVLNRPAREIFFMSGDFTALCNHAIPNLHDSGGIRPVDNAKTANDIDDILTPRDSIRTSCIVEFARYELVDHPLAWTGTDTGDLLYGLVEGIAIGTVNGVRSLVMITDPGFGNYPKVVVFPWTYVKSEIPYSPR